ncbi:MAG TPA: hypothetical protein PKM51_04220, partial [Chitinophagales bacterium]|nr:hypothetical protein [Chitinophagales bacterium]
MLDAEKVAIGSAVDLGLYITPFGGLAPNSSSIAFNLHFGTESTINTTRKIRLNSFLMVFFVE